LVRFFATVAASGLAGSVQLYRVDLDETALRDLLDQGSRETGYSLKPVNLSEEEIQKYYFGFSDEILWPLFHDLPSRCNFDPAYWTMYSNEFFFRRIRQRTLLVYTFPIQ